MSPYKEKIRAEYLTLRAKGHLPLNAFRIARGYARYKDGDKCPFDNKWGYAGAETRTYSNGWKLVFKIEYDSDYGPPWKEHDGHGEVEWVHRHLEEWEREWVLVWDGYSKLLYDRKASLEIAKRDGWGLGTPEEAVQADFDYLYGYCTEDWWYVGLIVELRDENDELVAEDACWGYETSDMTYLVAEARSWAAWMLKEHMPRYWQRLRQQELTLEEAT